MIIDVLTIFPDMISVPLGQSIIGRAQEEKKVALRAHDLRQWSVDKHLKVDDEPYGGGQGMVMKPEPFFYAVSDLKKQTPADYQTRVVMMTPQGRPLSQALAAEYAAQSQTHLIILCGHYEGVDHRVIEALVDDEVSIGDYVLTNGAIAATVFIDAVARLLPGVLGDERSAVEESFSEPQRLEAPCYTRPVEFEGRRVPDVLLSGHHAKVAQWKKEQALARTQKNRPDLLG
jgi:tRNA (guanine37-N1)-methyltransferase